jgi:DNA polymerase-1
MKESVMIIDGTNLLHRSHHALFNTNMRSADGNPTWALHGLLLSISNLASKFQPSHIVVAFDTPGGCKFRRELLPSYKANRGAPNQELGYQLAQAYVSISMIGIGAIAMSEYEADDLMATVANLALSKGMESIVVSSDRDCYQLIEEGVQVAKPDGTIITNLYMEEKYGISATRYRDLAALRGEPSDNLKGIPGIGEKNAVKLINSFDDIASLRDKPELIREVLSERLTSSLIENFDNYLVNLEIGKLLKDLPVHGIIEKSRLPLKAEKIREALIPLGLYNASSKLTTNLS